MWDGFQALSGDQRFSEFQISDPIICRKQPIRAVHVHRCLFAYTLSPLVHRDELKNSSTVSVGGVVLHVELVCLVTTCRASVPGCCSSFTVRPPATFWPRPSCQVRFPPVRRLSWCLKSSDRALYSTAGRQKLKLDAAAERRARAAGSAGNQRKQTHSRASAEGRSHLEAPALPVTSPPSSRLTCLDKPPFHTPDVRDEQRCHGCREAANSRWRPDIQ